MTKYAQVYILIWLIVLALFGTSIAAVTSGKGAMQFMGAKMTLANGPTYQLYRVTDNLAFEIGNMYISMVSYEKTSGLSSMAGEYQHVPADAAGSVFIVSADYQKDDYMYTAYPMARTSIVNIKTGEKVGPLAKSDPLAPDYKPVNAGQLPEYQQRGLLLEEQYKITPDKIIAKYQPLNTYNENLFVVQVAFSLIFTLLTLGGIPIIMFRHKKSGAV